MANLSKELKRAEIPNDEVFLKKTVRHRGRNKKVKVSYLYKITSTAREAIRSIDDFETPSDGFGVILPTTFDE